MDGGDVVEEDLVVGVSEGGVLVVPLGPIEEESVDVAAVLRRVVGGDVVPEELELEPEVVDGDVVLRRVKGCKVKIPCARGSAGLR